MEVSVFFGDIILVGMKDFCCAIKEETNKQKQVICQGVEVEKCWLLTKERLFLFLSLLITFKIVVNSLFLCNFARK